MSAQPTLPALMYAAAASLWLWTTATSAELSTTALTADDFGATEYKLLLKIDGLDPRASIEVLAATIDSALPSITIGRPDGGSTRTYVDTPKLRLKQENYILRVKGEPDSPHKAKLTLKQRVRDLSQSERLQGAGVQAGKQEIDYAGAPIYAISYKLNNGGAGDYPSGRMTGRELQAAIARHNADMGAWFASLLGDETLVVGGFVQSYSAKATLAAGALPAAPNGLQMGLDIFRFEDEVLAELSYTQGRLNAQSQATYTGLAAMLNAQGVLADTQMPKTSYCLHYFYEKHADRLPAP